ncbi:MAG TPA: class III extradiol ring-cleavage dioxygenase [Thermoanaerobaculia bacterium]|nr:class III extradiol ring-cleavage dioxygenase [Thermoanaerobaculia bacterium]
MRAPSVFVSHGAPDLALQRNAATEALAQFGRTIRAPRAVLVVSAHWMTRGIRVGGSAHPETIHDFGGFPRELFELRYPAPGDPALAARVATLLGEASFAAEIDPERGLDHGAWVPLRLLFPEPSIPVVPISIPAREPGASLLAAGRALAPLREEGILLLGSGTIVHNLATIAFGDDDATTPAWASSFDEWTWEAVRARDAAALLELDRRPEAPLAAPTPEHFVPLLFPLGALAPEERVEPIHRGFMYGTLSMDAWTSA